MTPQSLLTRRPQEPEIDLDSAIEQLRTKFNVPKVVVDRMVRQESGGNTSAVSPVGARGRFQVMPGTLDSINRETGKNLSNDNPLDNAFAGLYLLKQNYDKFRKGAPSERGAWMRAVAAYHAGAGNVQKDLDQGGLGIPDVGDGLINTRDHVFNIFDGTKPEEFGESAISAQPETIQQPIVPPITRTPKVTSTIKEEDSGQELSQVKPVAPIPFRQGRSAQRLSLNPVENVSDILERAPVMPHGIAGLQARRYESPESRQLGDRVILPVPKNAPPTEDQVVQSYLSTLGPEYMEAGERYKAQTGHNILSLGGGQLKQDEQGNYYVRPSKGAVDFLNTYIQSNGDLTKVGAEAKRQANEYIAAQNKAFEESNPDVTEAKKAMANVKDNPLVRKMFQGTAGLAQAFGTVVPGPLGDEFQRQAAVERAAGEQLDKDKPFTTTRERVLGGVGGLIPTAAMLIATHKLGPAQLAAMGILEGSTPEERLRGGLQGAVAQGMLSRAPNAFSEAGLPDTGKAVTSAAMVGQPAAESWQRGESPVQAITENLPFAALPLLRRGGAKPEAKPAETVRPASIAPVIAEARAERVRLATEGARPLEIAQRAAPPEAMRIERAVETSKLNRWQHRDFGLVTETADQSRVGRGRVRVLAEDGIEHVIQRPNGRGAGNQIAIPLRGADPVEPAFKVIDRRRQFPPMELSRQTPANEPQSVTPITPTEVEPVIRQRAFPRTLERSGLPGGTERDYTVVTNAESLQRATQRIETDGVDRAASDLAAKKDIGADDTATGILLIRQLQEQGQLEKAVDVAGDLSRKLTQAGQATQAASIVSRLSPEGVLLAAQRQLPAERKLTRGQAESLMTQAKRVEQAESRVAATEKAMQDSGALPVTEKAARQRIGNLQERLVTMEQEARARLEARKAQMLEATKGPRGQRGAAVNPAVAAADIGDFAIIGAAKLARKGITYAQWTAEMLEEFGDAVRPHLRRLYSQSYKLYDDQRKQFLQESRERGARRAEPDATDIQRVINERLDAQTDARKARADLARTFRDLSATPLRKLGRGVLDTVGLTRALTTTGDLSFGFRQGKMGLARHPRIWAGAFVKQFQALNTKQYERLVSQLETDPEFKYARRFGLDLTSVGGSEHSPLGAREEAFQSRFVQKLPIVRHSEQAYSTMADHLRMGWFKDYVKNLRKLGLDPENPKDRQAFEEGASLINKATGRGDLGRLQSASPALATVLFSPRFWVSRLQMMTLPFDPRTYTTMSRPARVEAFKTLFSYAALVSSQLALAKLSGAEVDTDPDSPDFLKARWGKLHVDFSAGFQSHIRVAVRLMKAFYDRQQGRKTKTEPVNVLEHYFRSKESPNASLIHDLFLSQKKKVRGETYGTDFKGDPTALLGVPGNRRDTSALANRLLPMVISDASDAYDADGWAGVGEVLPLAITGEGVSVYDPKKKRGH
jgi:hypothetical protein